jgi:hypothetical protein
MTNTQHTRDFAKRRSGSEIYQQNLFKCSFPIFDKRRRDKRAAGGKLSHTIREIVVVEGAGPMQQVAIVRTVFIVLMRQRKSFSSPCMNYEKRHSQTNHFQVPLAVSR